MKPSKKHTFVIRVSMDKACSRAVALRQVREELKGQDYYTSNFDRDPDQFWIRNVKSTPKAVTR